MDHATRADEEALPQTGWMRYVLLGFALVAVAVVAFHPHYNVLTGEKYEFPVHMDAYVHWGRAKAALDQGTVLYLEMFHPESSADATDFRHRFHERGYHSYLAAVKEAAGVGWLAMWVYMPTVIAVFLALVTFAVAERWRSGVEAALWVAAIPTSLRFLGPGFGVPIVFSLPLVLTGAFILFHMRGTRRGVLLGLIISSLWLIHSMGALALSSLVAVYVLVIPRRAWLDIISLASMTTLPLLVVWPYITRFTSADRWHMVPTLPPSIPEVRLFGHAAFAAAALGSWFLLLDRNAATRRAAMTLSVAVAAVGAVVVIRFASDNDPIGIYDRSLMVLYAICCILGGVAVARLRTLGIDALSRMGWRNPTVIVVLLLLTAQSAAVAASAKQQMEQPYYQVLTEERYRSYTAASSHLSPAYHQAVVDGPMSMPFSILTERILFYIHYPQSQMPTDLVQFFVDGSRDTAMLVETGTSIVVTEKPVMNPDLIEVAPGVYMLRPEYTERMAPALSN